MKKMNHKWNLATSAIFALLGMIIAQLMLYFKEGRINFSMILGAVLGAILIIFLNIRKVHKKTDRTPEVDERIYSNMLHFTALASHYILLFEMTLLAIISFLDIKKVSVLHLWIVLFLHLFIIGFGNLIIKKR